MRYVPLILLLLLGACGGSGDERKEKAAEAWAAVKGEYEARNALIVAALKEAPGKLAGSLEPVALGDGPKPKFETYKASGIDKTANARIVLLDADDSASAKLLTLLVEKRWRTDMDKNAADNGGTTEGGLKSDLAQYLAVRYLCVVKTSEYTAPKITDTSLFKVKFEAGQWTGTAALYDLTTGKLLGGAAITARNTDSVKFKTEGIDADEQKRLGQVALEADLREQVLALLRTTCQAE
jgi:hypothetical protein